MNEKCDGAIISIRDLHKRFGPVEVLVQTGNGLGTPRLRSRTMKADPGPDTLKALEKLFGASHIRLVRTSSEKHD